MTLNEKIEQYAEAIVKKGINLHKGEKVRIVTPIDTLPFARKVMAKAFHAGAADVYMDYVDDETDKIRYTHAPNRAFNAVTPWDRLKADVMTEEKINVIYILSPNPDVFSGVDPDVLGKWTRTQAVAYEKYSRARARNDVRWSIAAAATPVWARKVFPEVNEDESVDRLWRCILHCTRMDADNPLKALEAHDRSLSNQSRKLLLKKYRKLYFKGPGTDIEVALLDNQLWFGGGTTATNGLRIMPNIPTEEIATSPHRMGTNGKVRCTMPLVYSGNTIENLWFKFKDGKVVDFGADSCAGLIHEFLKTDEGANYLGEVALVPVTSPISKYNRLFYNTLYDENASCHFALGKGFPMCFEGAEGKTEKEMQKEGLNYSKVHLDFMIGSDKLDIVGELPDASREHVFKNGRWAI